MLSSKTEWSGGFGKGNTGEEVPVRKLEPIITTDAFRGTCVEEKIVINGEGCGGTEIVHSLREVGEVHVNQISVM